MDEDAKDAEIAMRLHRELNGLPPRRSRATAFTKVQPEFTLPAKRTAPARGANRSSTGKGEQQQRGPTRGQKRSGSVGTESTSSSEEDSDKSSASNSGSDEESTSDSEPLVLKKRKADQKAAEDSTPKQSVRKASPTVAKKPPASQPPRKQPAKQQQQAKQKHEEPARKRKRIQIEDSDSEDEEDQETDSTESSESKQEQQSKEIEKQREHDKSNRSEKLPLDNDSTKERMTDDLASLGQKGEPPPQQQQVAPPPVTRPAEAASATIADASKDQLKQVVSRSSGVKLVKVFFQDVKYGINLRAQSLNTRDDLAAALNENFVGQILSCGRGDTLHIEFVSNNGDVEVFQSLRIQGTKDNQAHWRKCLETAVKVCVRRS